MYTRQHHTISETNSNSVSDNEKIKNISKYVRYHSADGRGYHSILGCFLVPDVRKYTKNQSKMWKSGIETETENVLY